MSGSDPLAVGPPPEHEVKALLREAGVAVPRGATAASEIGRAHV